MWFTHAFIISVLCFTTLCVQNVGEKSDFFVMAEFWCMAMDVAICD